MVTIKDIAAQLGIHHSSVSRALRDDPQISSALRARVRDAARRLGYVPDPMLSALVNYRTGKREHGFQGNLAWLLLDQHLDPDRHAGLRTAFTHAAARATELGYHLEEFHLTEPGMTPRRLREILLARGVAGILVPPLSLPGTRLDFDFTGFSAVRVGHTLAQPALHMVAPRQYTNMRETVRRLHQAGHRRIGFFLPRIIDDRTEGAYSAGFWREQLELPPKERIPPLIPEARDTTGFDQKAFLRWFKKHRPDVLITLPTPVRDWLAEIGVKVPRDLTITLPSEIGREGGAVGYMDENWPEIYRTAINTLAGLVQRRETGVPAHPIRVLVEGTWHAPQDPQ